MLDRYVRQSILDAGVAVCGIRWLRRERHHGAPMGPVEILKARYARGELSKQDFESMRQDVER